MTSDFRQHEVSQALAGDTAALARLIRLSTPVIQARVARGLLLWRQGGNAGRDVRQEVEDLTQEVFLVLFADDGRVLRSWQPERGLTLAGFVGLVAERQVASILRSGRRSPWRDDPTLPARLDEIADGQGPEALVASREQMRRLLDRLTEELSPLGRQLFQLLFLDELAIDDAARQTGLSPEALYAWRSRLRRLCRRLLAEMSDRTPGERKTPMDAHA
jgi:RNA polymerase sigma factor (sigma-70 family)